MLNYSALSHTADKCQLVPMESLDKHIPSSGRASRRHLVSVCPGLRRCLWSVFKWALGDEDEGELGVLFEDIHWEKLMCKSQLGTSVPSVIISQEASRSGCLELQSNAYWLLCCSREGCGAEEPLDILEYTQKWLVPYVLNIMPRGKSVPSG